ncbi:hypothetical protein EDB81DRAFT_196552 [Dactylonectria macrodidyma]|uniref:Uncharacterized protein n=1 Tax=Dactylonectria macrodidyma TaxID=307937 RepID=A0A9P9FSW6_9HYPO|nr:hypothetical protein EDB81DRAFT_196552 [Dactylonectria macrodidyma]
MQTRHTNYSGTPPQLITMGLCKLANFIDSMRGLDNGTRALHINASMINHPRQLPCVYDVGGCLPQEEGGIWDKLSRKGRIPVYIGIALTLLFIIVMVMRCARRRWNRDKAFHRLERDKESRHENTFDLETGTELDTVLHVPAPKAQCPDRHRIHESPWMHAANTHTRPPSQPTLEDMSAPPPAYESTVQLPKYAGAGH